MVGPISIELARKKCLIFACISLILELHFPGKCLAKSVEL